MRELIYNTYHRDTYHFCGVQLTILDGHFRDGRYYYTYVMC